ncbi:hypothetical protein RFI_29847 [Reticulomyxa filosa]|uniref:Uncharacterized protein n=1 Tax=Reticulomyxa filosa TaxID=46433 RepID=X6M0Z8_RETFI|nr:hypothetical protein RFI_29847 [Reticulomyxa filosa]|eukprot:ETO07544.1 hypothetical protein RFI_29847 [Reticulomyxa filosa]
MLFLVEVNNSNKENTKINSFRAYKIVLNYSTSSSFVVFKYYQKLQNTIFNIFVENLLKKLLIYVHTHPFHYLEKKISSIYIIKSDLKQKNKMTTLGNEKRTSIQLALVSFISSFQKVFFCCFIYWYSEEEKIQVIVQHWIRILQIKFGWINELDKLIVNYVSLFALSFF